MEFLLKYSSISWMNVGYMKANYYLLSLVAFLAEIFVSAAKVKQSVLY